MAEKLLVVDDEAEIAQLQNREQALFPVLDAQGSHLFR